MTGLLDSATPLYRSRLFWAGLGAVIAVQFAAFWMLCNQQVALAQARHAQIQIHRTALADCLRYIPGATPASCKGGILRANAPVVTTVSFSR